MTSRMEDGEACAKKTTISNATLCFKGANGSIQVWLCNPINSGNIFFLFVQIAAHPGVKYNIHL